MLMARVTNTGDRLVAPYGHCPVVAWRQLSESKIPGSIRQRAPALRVAASSSFSTR